VRRAATFALLLAVWAAAVGQAQAPAVAAPPWRDTYQSRLQALALMQTLNAEILASTSATRSLESWCRSQQLAADPRIVADRVTGTAKLADAEQLARLNVTGQHELRYRRVRLRCGDRVLSEADNWYVPARLTDDMNHTLETTTAPFGRVVAPLEPYRRTIAARVLWWPLSRTWSRETPPMPADGPLAIPAALFEHRAVLYTRAHEPFSEVVEVYQRDLLGDPPSSRLPEPRPF
jgi:chorismate-pyruvate lyase